MFYKGEVPFLRLLIPLIMGIVSAMEFPYADFKAGIMFFLITALALLMLNLFYKKWLLYKRGWIAGFLIHCFLFIAGFIVTNQSSEVFDPNHFSKKQGDAMVVKVISEPKLSNDILRFVVQIEQVTTSANAVFASGKLMVALKVNREKPLQLNYGDVLLINNQFNEIDPPFNPSEFNFKGYLANQQIYHQVYINQDEAFLIKRGAGNRIISFSLALRKLLVEKFQNYLPDQEASSVASTLILGYRADLSKETINAFSKTGTMHVLSVSGMHVGIVCLLLNFLLKPLNRNKRLSQLRIIILILAIWFYALITGFSPSVGRAATMLTFVISGKALNKNNNPYNLLAISAFLLLLINPFYLMDVSFQLSYLAVIGLVYLHPKIYHSIHFKNKLYDSAWNYSALSLAAQFATFPISIYYFHQFPLYFLLSNLIIVIPVAIIMYSGIMFLFIPFVSLLKPLGLLINWIILMVNRGLIFIEHLPFASLSGLWISTSQYILIYLILGCLCAIISYKNRFALKAMMPLFFVFSLSITFKLFSDQSRHELLFYSLRKNAAIAYIHNGEAYLVSDLLYNDKILTFSIQPALASRGITSIKNIQMAGFFSNEEVKVSTDYMQFGHFKMIRWNKGMDSLKFTRKVRCDLVLLSGNPSITIKRVTDNVESPLLLIDATNPDYKIRKWKEEASELKIPAYILKNQPAYVLQTN